MFCGINAINILAIKKIIFSIDETKERIMYYTGQSHSRSNNQTKEAQRNFNEVRNEAFIKKISQKGKTNTKKY